jgi:hypothetical protein
MEITGKELLKQLEQYKSLVKLSELNSMSINTVQKLIIEEKIRQTKEMK